MTTNPRLHLFSFLSSFFSQSIFIITQSHTRFFSRIYRHANEIRSRSDHRWVHSSIEHDNKTFMLILVIWYIEWLYLVVSLMCSIHLFSILMSGRDLCTRLNAVSDTDRNFSYIRNNDDDRFWMSMSSFSVFSIPLRLFD